MINREIEPKIIIPKHIEVKKEKLILSEKNVSIYKLDFDQFDVFRISFVFNAGVKYQKKPFLANTTLSMLSESTISRNSKKIAEILDFYGLYFDTSIDRDYSVVTICGLNKFFEKAIDIFSDILLNPVFPKKELKILLNKRKQSLKVERQKVDYIAREKFISALYGENHPYGSVFNLEKYDDIHQEDLIDFYKDNYLRDNLFVVTSGNLTDEQFKKVSILADTMPQKSFEVKSVPQPESILKESFTEKKGALQSAIRIGRVLFNRSHKDFIKMQVLSTILGGYFSSRLIKNLREDKGYTYSIFSAVVNMEDSGYFVITSEVSSKYTKEAVEEIFLEIDKLCNEPVDQEELNMVKSVIIGEVMRILDGPFGIADVTIENVQNKVSNSYLNDMLVQIENITPQDILLTANNYLKRDQITTVVVGA